MNATNDVVRVVVAAPEPARTLLLPQHLAWCAMWILLRPSSSLKTPRISFVLSADILLRTSELYTDVREEDCE